MPILNNPNNSSGFSTVNLTISEPIGGANLGAIASATLIIVNNSNPENISSFVVYNTADSGPGSLRQAIIDADSDPNPGVDNIVFAIPASTAANLNVPVAGFDPIDQTWTITLQSALPVITHAVNIDGGTQAAIGVPLSLSRPGQLGRANTRFRRRSDRRRLHAHDVGALTRRHDATHPLFGERSPDPDRPPIDHSCR